MTATAQRAPIVEEDLRFSLDEPVEIDVSYCDVVPARPQTNAGPFELKFRGTRQPDGQLVRGFVPLLEIEGPMVAAGAIESLINTDGVAHGARPVAVALLKYALTITKRRKGNGTWAYDVDVRSGSAAVDLKQYLRALRDAGEAALALQGQGYAVGATDVITMAGQLFAVRVNRKEGGGR